MSIITSPLLFHSTVALGHQFPFQQHGYSKTDITVKIETKHVNKYHMRKSLTDTRKYTNIQRML